MKRDVAFLPDEDSFGFAACIRHYRVLEYSDVGLQRGALDKKVVEHAREHGAIVLSRNVSDFLRVMRDAAAASSHGDCQAMHCHEGGGLLTISPTLNGFHFERLTRELRLGEHAISWYEVYFLNLRVHVGADERVGVTILPACERCLRLHAAACSRCTELELADVYAAQGVLLS